jgi:hypothetical protein
MIKMGSLGNEEKYDIFGCKLARQRVFKMASYYLKAEEGTIEDCIALDYKPEEKDFPGLKDIVDELLPEESFFLKEYGPAKDPEFIIKNAKRARNTYKGVYDPSLEPTGVPEGMFAVCVWDPSNPEKSVPTIVGEPYKAKSSAISYVMRKNKEPQPKIGETEYFVMDDQGSRVF